METALLNTPTQARENVFFSNFKNNKRIRWSAHRRFGH